MWDRLVTNREKSEKYSDDRYKEEPQPLGLRQSTRRKSLPTPGL